MAAWCSVHYKAKDLQNVSPGRALFQLGSRKGGGGGGGGEKMFLKGPQNASL